MAVEAEGVLTLAGKATLTGNTATHGGGIYATGVISLSLHQSELSSNVATNGGAMVLESIDPTTQVGLRAAVKPVIEELLPPNWSKFRRIRRIFVDARKVLEMKTRALSPS